MPAVIPLALISISFLVFLTRNQRRWVRYSLSVSLVAAVLLLAVISNRFVTSLLEIRLWQPLNLPVSALTLVLDPISWRYLVLVLAFLLGLQLMGGILPTSSSRQESITTLLVGFSSVAMMAANLLTALLAWALMDLTAFAYWYARRDEESKKARDTIATRAGGVVISMLLLLAAGMVDWGAGGDASFLTPVRSSLVHSLLAIALVVRTMAFHRSITVPGNGDRWPQADTWYTLLPVVSGCAFLARQLKSEVVLDSTSIYLMIGALGSGILLWSALRGFNRHPWTSLALLCWSLLAVGMAGAESDGIVAGGLLILTFGLSITAHTIFDHFNRILMGAVLAMAVAAPFTLGGVLGTLLSDAVSSAVSPLSVLAICFGMIFAVELGYQGIVKVTSSASSWPVSERALRGIYHLGSGIPLLIALGLGLDLFPSVTFGSLLYSFLCLGIVCLVFFFLKQRLEGSTILMRLRAHRHDAAGAAAITADLIAAGLNAVRSFGDLLEGENAVLWMLFTLLMLVLLILR